MNEIVFFDLETGGFNPNKHAIIQIAAIAVDASTFETTGEFECKVQFPHSAADPEALKANNYDADVWATEAIHPDKAAPAFSTFLSDHATVPMVSKAGKDYVVAQGAAHNAKFDASFIQAWYRRRNAFLSMSFNVLCTYQLAAWHYLNRDDAPENLNLETLAFHLKIWDSKDKYHDAMQDVKTTVQIAKRLTRSEKVNS